MKTLEQYLAEGAELEAKAIWELAQQFTHLDGCGWGRTACGACDALNLAHELITVRLPRYRNVIKDMRASIAQTDATLHKLAKVLRDGSHSDERLRVAEHDAVLIACGFLNTRGELAEFDRKLALGEYDAE